MHKKKNRSVPLLCLAWLTAMSCLGASQLTFSSNGKPATLVLNGVNRYSSNSTDGFHLRYFNGQDVTDTLLGNAVTEGNLVTVSVSGGLPRFTFRIDAYDKHLSIHLVNVEGLADDEMRKYGIRFQLNANAAIGFKTLDDVAEGSVSGGRLYAYWRYLWGQELGGSRGGIAIYDYSLTGVALDACLASIWANEPLLPHPAGQASWTEADVLAWVENYRTNIVDLNEVILEASSPAELYSLTDTLFFRITRSGSICIPKPGAVNIGRTIIHGSM